MFFLDVLILKNLWFVLKYPFFRDAYFSRVLSLVLFKESKLKGAIIKNNEKIVP